MLQNSGLDADMELTCMDTNGQSHSRYEADLFYCLRLEGKDSLNWLQECLKRGEDVSCTYKGWTFLTSLCSIGRLDVLRAVIEHLKQECICENMSCRRQKHCRNRQLNFVLNDYDDNGDTPLTSAARKGHLDICRLLTQEGADINVSNQQSGQTPLLTAVESNRPEVVSFFLENFADTQQTDNVGITPLYSAIRLKSEQLVQDLISNGCDVNIGSQDHSPLFYATRVGSLPIVKTLCNAGCAKDVSNKYGVTPVYEAALKGHCEVLKYLLDEGCNPNLVDMYGQSPLHIAALSGNLSAIRLLYQAGAMCKLRNQQGHTAIDMALDAGRADILEYLLERGVNILRLSSRWKKRTDQEGYDVVLLLSDRLSFLENESVLEVLIRGYANFACEPVFHMVPLVRSDHHPKCHLVKLLLLSRTNTPNSYVSLVKEHHCKELCDLIDWFDSNPRSLKDICRVKIRDSLGEMILHKTQFLPLPSGLKDFITMKNL